MNQPSLQTQESDEQQTSSEQISSWEGIEVVLRKGALDSVAFTQRGLKAVFEREKTSEVPKEQLFLAEEGLPASPFAYRFLCGFLGAERKCASSAHPKQVPVDDISFATSNPQDVVIAIVSHPSNSSLFYYDREANTVSRPGSAVWVPQLAKECRLAVGRLFDANSFAGLDLEEQAERRRQQNQLGGH